MLKKCQFVFDILESNGYECYAVGGCVRDMLLGIIPNDIDFTTNATPDEILNCFKEYKTFELGKKFGTISVVKDKNIYEITTYRIDGKYSDSRHPDSIEFSAELKDDLSRRDFTINAMAMDKKGKITDIFGGREDLKNKIIRTVGNPQRRFSEDALRILRALRFSAKLGFIIDKETSVALTDMKDSLKDVHPQRLRDELYSLMTSENCADILWKYKDVLAVIIPELRVMFDYNQHNIHHCFDLFEHTAEAIRLSPCIPEIRFTLLFHDIGKPLCQTADDNGVFHFYGHPDKSAEIAFDILKRFGFSSEFTDKICNIIRYHDTRFTNPVTQIKRLLSKISEEDFKNLITVMRCDVGAQSDYKRSEKLSNIDLIEIEFHKIVNEKPCIKLADLAVNGFDLQELGLSGKSIGDTLNMLLDMVIEDTLANNKTELLQYVKSHLRH